jgi:HEAT repeat protein
MGLKETVMELLRAGDGEGLRRLASDDRRTLRHLMGRLWDPDVDLRRRTAEAIGDVADSHPDLGREALRRMMWSLTDEAATNGRYAVPVLAAVAVRDPDLAAPFVGPVASLLWDRGLRPEIVAALERIRDHRPELVDQVGDVVRRHLDPVRPEDRRDLIRILGNEEEETDGA